LSEETGGLIDLRQITCCDPTLRQKKLLVTSQERMGLVIAKENIDILQTADRERSPMYQVGDVTGDHRFIRIKKLLVLNQWIMRKISLVVLQK
jgi:phosphoribosylformylglycinamidine synthase